VVGNTAKRYALHMKPGCGPTIEGLLVRRTRREFVLIAAQMLEDADRSHEIGGHVTVPRENVYCLQEIR
jgi:hypothetical protein